jgi:hypothetical protein
VARDLKTKVVLEGDGSGANRAIKSTETAFGKLTSSVKRFGVAQIAQFAAIVFAIKRMANAFASVVKASSDQEDSIRRLTSALSDLGAGTDAVVQSLSEQATQLQKTTTFADEAIINAQARIAAFTSEESAIKALTQASVDFAAAQGIDVVSAANLLGKTFGSSANALARYGVAVEGAADSSERLRSVVGGVTELFGGRAAAVAETFSGRIAQLKNVFGELEEAVGDSITKNDELASGIETLKGNIEQATPQVAALSQAMVQLAVGSVNALSEFGRFIGDAALTLGDLEENTDATRVSQEALNSTAERLGITVAELQINLAAAALRTQALDVASAGAAQSLLQQAGAAASAASASKNLAAENEIAATAMEKLAKSLDEISESTLTAELLEIQTNLEAVRVTTGGTSLEFERLESIALAKIGVLQDRIRSIRDGMGDLGEATTATAIEMDTLSESVEGAGDATLVLQDGIRLANTALQQAATAARITSAAYDQLARSAGQAAAIQAALAGGGTLTQAGARIRLPGGGSRLTSDPRTGNPSTVNTGFYTGSVGTFRVNPDGSLTRI